MPDRPDLALAAAGWRVSCEGVSVMVLLAPPAAGLVALFTWWTPVFGCYVAAGVAWGLSLCASIAVGVVAAHSLLARDGAAGTTGG